MRILATTLSSFGFHTVDATERDSVSTVHLCSRQDFALWSPHRSGGTMPGGQLIRKGDGSARYNQNATEPGPVTSGSSHPSVTADRARPSGARLARSDNFLVRARTSTTDCVHYCQCSSVVSLNEQCSYAQGKGTISGSCQTCVDGGSPGFTTLTFPRCTVPSSCARPIHSCGFAPLSEPR